MRVFRVRVSVGVGLRVRLQACSGQSFGIAGLGAQSRVRVQSLGWISTIQGKDLGLFRFSGGAHFSVKELHEYLP